jgi:glutathione-regulated potassium-efflux system ancillary protein KefG
MPDHRILLLFAHPAFHRSRANKALIQAASTIEGVTFHDLYAHYPHFDIDIRREQSLLSSHDTIIFQHPLYWYSTPAILKEWQDLVLEFGWAYGPGGTALQNKHFLSAITTAGSREAYTHTGMHERTIQELLAPIDQTFRLCKMKRFPPLVFHSAQNMTTEKLQEAGHLYQQILKALLAGSLTPENCTHLDRLNEAPHGQ